jgi:hypothetical protein
MRDITADYPLAFLTERPDVAINQFDFVRLRLIVHFILRAERWTDGNYSAILNALANGLLPAIADKLRNDRSLYLPE